MSAPSGDMDALRRAVSSIPKNELVAICEAEFGEAATGDPWRSRLKREIVQSLVTTLPEARVRELAADGYARVRTPGFLGFIWHLHDYDEEPTTVLSALGGITDEHLAGELTSPRIVDVNDENLQEPLGRSVFVELQYVTEDWQVTPDGQTHRIERHRTANIAIDLFTGVLTVFASPARSAGIIADGVASLLQANVTPLTLNQVAVPSVNGSAFAPSTLRVLEVVYGRFAERYDILHAPTIWIRPMAEGAVARERASSGEGADMFADPVVRAELSSGAEIRGIRFHLRERPQDGDRSASLATLAATVKADDQLGISLRLARGGYPTDRVMRIYEDLRSKMMRPAPSSGATLTARLRAIA